MASRTPDYTGGLWLLLGFLIVVGLISRIPTVGWSVAFGVVLLVIVAWIGSLFVKAARPRRR